MPGDLDMKPLRDFLSENANTPVVKALRAAVEIELSDLIDIRTIDLNGNVGLQTTARRMAYERLDAFFMRLGIGDRKPSSEKTSFR